MATRKKPSKKAGPTVLESLTYNKSKIEILEDRGQLSLKVGKKTIPCFRDDVTGSYSSTDLPYQTFGSLAELGKALIDQKEAD